MAVQLGDVAGWLGVVAGVGGLVYAHLAKRESHRATSKAEEANDYARRSEARETERHETYWEGDWAGPGRYVLVKRGRSVAYDVVARVEVDDEVREESREQVAENEQLELNFPQAVAALERERRERRERRDARRRSWSAIVPIPFFETNNHWIEERVTWRTELKVPRFHESRQSLATLGRSRRRVNAAVARLELRGATAASGVISSVPPTPLHRRRSPARTPHDPAAHPSAPGT